VSLTQCNVDIGPHRSCVEAHWRHAEELAVRTIFASHIIVEDTAISTVVQFVDSLSMSPAVIR
jgi:hypothetical protein